MLECLQKLRRPAPSGGHSQGDARDEGPNWRDIALWGACAAATKAPFVRGARCHVLRPQGALQGLVRFHQKGVSRARTGAPASSARGPFTDGCCRVATLNRGTNPPGRPRRCSLLLPRSIKRTQQMERSGTRHSTIPVPWRGDARRSLKMRKLGEKSACLRRNADSSI